MSSAETRDMHSFVDNAVEVAPNNVDVQITVKGVDGVISIGKGRQAEFKAALAGQVFPGDLPATIFAKGKTLSADYQEDNY